MENWEMRGVAVKMNILILSCGTRNKIIQYFKKELYGNGLVLAADCSHLAPAIHEADQHFIIPKIHDKEYLDSILSICKKNNVKAIFSLIDPEINLLAKHKQEFLDIGTLPILSDYDVVEMCFNKYMMYEFLKINGFKTVRSYLDKDKFFSDIEGGLIKYPVFLKPVKGSASINISKVASRAELEILFNQHDNLMIQEFIDGVEYGADVYIDMISNETVAIFVKEKISMRSGETCKAVSIKDPILFELINKFVKKAGLKGIIDIDIFGINGEYYISEVNPRFGGGYPHAYESGVNMPKMIINNVSGRINSDVIGGYDEGIYMMKYNEVGIYRGNKKILVKMTNGDTRRVVKTTGSR